MSQVILAPTSHPSHAVWIGGREKYCDISCATRRFFSAIFALYLMVFWWDAIHVPSLAAVAVSRNVSGSSGTSTDC